MKTLIEMAREAGLRSAVLLHMYGKESALCDSEIEELRQLERFAELVRADEREKGQRWFDAVTAQHKQLILAEREACARICDELNTPEPNTPADCADAIRARGQA